VRAPLSRRGQSTCISALIAALLGLAAVLGPPVIENAPYLPDISLAWWAMALAFAATDLFGLHVQERRETQTITLNEIPLVLGLHFATPMAMLAGRTIGSLATMVFYRRSPPLKIVFNVSLLVSETCLALTIFRALAPSTPVAGPATWLAAYAAALPPTSWAPSSSPASSPRATAGSTSGHCSPAPDP